VYDFRPVSAFGKPVHVAMKIFLKQLLAFDLRHDILTISVEKRTVSVPKLFNIFFSEKH
jgi:hypothetical protein